MKYRTAPPVLLVLLATARLMAAEVWVVNPNSSTSRLPAMRPAAEGATPAAGALPAQAEGASVYADRFDGVEYIYVKDLSPYGSAKVSLAGSSAPAMETGTQGATLTVTTDAGTWTFAAQGALAFSPHEAKGTPPSPTLETEAAPRLLYAGAALSVLAYGAEKEEIRIHVYRSGAVEVRAAAPKTQAAFTFAQTPPFLASVQKLKGAALRQVPYRFANTRNREIMAITAPLDWALYGEGIALLAAPAVGSAHAGPPAIQGSALLFLPTSAAEPQTALAERVSLLPPLMLDTDLRGTLGGGNAVLAVRDRDGDGVPDFDSDLWAIDRGGDGKIDLVLSAEETEKEKDNEPEVIAYYLTKGIPLDEIQLAPAVPETDDFKQMHHGQRAERKDKTLEATLGVEDWNDDGIVFTGSLLEGGYLMQDRAFSASNLVSAFDLDGDGDIDIYYTNTSCAFDMEDELLGMIPIEVDAAAARVGTVRGTGGVKPNTTNAEVSWYNKTYQSGRFYKGEAHLNFEEHIQIILSAGENPAFPDGLNVFMKSTNASVDRMTFGNLDVDHISGFHWNMELAAGGQDRDYYDIAVYRDPWGHEMKILTPIYPLRWDGKGGWRRDPEHGNALEPIPGSPWTRHAVRDVVRPFHMAYSPEGHHYSGNECMYGGALTYEERQEDGEAGGTYTLYIDDLLGAFHMKGTQTGFIRFTKGWRSDPFLRNRWYHYVDAVSTPGLFQGVRDMMIMGPVMMRYYDEDEDGYVDAYYFDIDNDGLVDRTAHYDRAGSFLTLQEGRFLAAWPHAVQTEEVGYLLEKVDRIKKLYRSGFDVEPVVVRFGLGSSGRPHESEPYQHPHSHIKTRRLNPVRNAIVFSDAWLPKATAYAEPGDPGRYTWIDFGPGGLAKLGWALTREGLRTETLRGEITPEALATTEVFVLGHLEHIPTETELAALLAFVKRGGRLIVNFSAETETDRRFLNILGETLGYTLGEPVERRSVVVKQGTIRAPLQAEVAPYTEKRVPSPENRIEHFEDHTGSDLLEGIEYISFTGSPLTLETPMRPVLSYKGEPFVAEATFGEGTILVSGMNLFANKHLGHTDIIGPFGMRDLHDRLRARILTGMTSLEVEEVRYEATPSRYSYRDASGEAVYRFNGRGGEVFLPDLWIGQEVSVNDQPAMTKRWGVMSLLTLPAGAHTVRITSPGYDETEKETK